MKKTLVAAVFALLFVTLAACGDNAATPQSDSQVDFEVISDVVEEIFMMPGEGIRRGMRVNQFTRDLGVRKCGGTGLKLDDTSGRFDQTRFADLDLIRERGLIENSSLAAEDEAFKNVDPDCDLLASFPGVDRRMSLSAAWGDIVLTAENDPSLTDTKAEMAKCLSRRTGYAIDESEPAGHFLRTVNAVLANSLTDHLGPKLAVAYADCGSEYFVKLGKLLSSQRPKLVERHREVISTYAAQLVAAGYVP